MGTFSDLKEEAKALRIAQKNFFKAKKGSIKRSEHLAACKSREGSVHVLAKSIQVMFVGKKQAEGTEEADCLMLANEVAKMISLQKTWAKERTTTAQLAAMAQERVVDDLLADFDAPVDNQIKLF